MIDTLATEGFPGVKFDLLVPCVDCVRTGSQDSWLFASSAVRRATELKAPFLQCGKMFHLVSLSSLHTLMPPSNLTDFHLQLNSVIRELDEVDTSAADQILFSILCHSANFAPDPKNASEGGTNRSTCPKRIRADLLKKFGHQNGDRVKIELITEVEATVASESLKLIKSAVVVICVSDEFCASPDCTNIVGYMKGSSEKQLIVAVVSPGASWKLTAVGMLFASELYVDLSDPNRYEVKLNELLTRLTSAVSRKKKIRTSAAGSTANRQYPKVFISYCWSNSARAVEMGRKSSPDALGPVDPREIKDFLTEKGVDCWLDVEQTGAAGLFEDIAEALRHAKLVLACVSDQYSQSQSCMQEFRFATGVLKVPMILCPVGTGSNWQTSEIAFLALNCPRVDFQVKRESEWQRLLELSQTQLKLNANQSSSQGKAKSKSDSDDSYQLYQELVELAERKFLQQIAQISPKIRSDLGESNVYPRLFLLDLMAPKLNESGRPATAGGNNSQQLTATNTGIRLICEEEKVRRISNIPATAKAHLSAAHLGLACGRGGNSIQLSCGE